MNLALLALVLFAAGPALAAYPVAPRISVESEEVTLADLVPGAPEAWTRVALGRAPRPGGVRTLDREWVLQRARLVGAQGDLELAGDVVLERTGQTVGREEVVRVVTEALARRLGPEERVEVTSVGLPGSLPMGELELRVRLPEGALPSPTTLWVDVDAGERRVGQAWARVEMSRGRPLLALTRTVRRGEVFRADDLEVRAGEGNSGDLLSDPSEVVGKVATRTLSAGAPLSIRDLASLPAVGRGDAVRLVARVGGVTATVLGKSLETAGVGDVVEVENLTSGRTLTGVLLEGGVVDVTVGVGR